MATSVAVFIEPKIAESTQVTQYTSSGSFSIIDKFTATNYDSATRTISVNLVASGGTAGNNNLIVKTKSLLAGETYTFPEIVGQTLADGDFISTIASTATSITIRSSGRLVVNN